MEGMQPLERWNIDTYERNLPTLLPDRHHDSDYFVCNILDAAPKVDLGSMEHGAPYVQPCHQTGQQNPTLRA